MKNDLDLNNVCNVIQSPSKPELIMLVNKTNMREVTKIMIFQIMAKMLQAETQMKGWFVRFEIQGIFSALMAEAIIDPPLYEKLTKLASKEWEDYRITLPE